MISWTVSDSSANENGLVSTTGIVQLGQRPGSADIEDYKRENFKRGELVTLDMVTPEGVEFRHPRGYLYVISTAYIVEEEVTEIEIGCRLALAILNDDPSEILPLLPVSLDESRQTIQNCSAALFSVGMLCYQNNNGSLVTKTFFDGDTASQTQSGKFVSILGVTALSVSPLQGATAIPNTLKLSYEQPTQFAAGESPRTDTSESVSKYFVSYPAMTWKRSATYCTETGPDGRPTQIACVDYVTPPPTTETPGSGGGCGNAPLPPTSAARS